MEKITSKKYQEIMAILHSNCLSSNTRMIGFLRSITIDDVQLLIQYIVEKLPLREYREQCQLNKYSCLILYTNFIPKLFSENEMIDYFLYFLIELHEVESIWMKPNKMKNFKQIVGFNYSHYQKRNLIFGANYEIAFQIFKTDYYYPNRFKEETISIIKANLSLSTIHDKFYSIYNSPCVEGSSFLKYLDLYILDKVGISKFENYLDTMVQLYSSSLVYQSVSTNTSDRILNFIFGCHWSFSRNMTDHKYKRDIPIALHRRIHKIILSKVFPLIISSYITPRSRNFVYTVLELTQNEITNYEKKFHSIDIHEIKHHLLNIPENPASVSLRNGTLFSEIFDQIDGIFEYYKISRVVPTKAEIRKVLLKDAISENLTKDLRYCFKTSSADVIFKHYYDKKLIELKRHFFESNANDQIMTNDIWTIYYPSKENFKRTVLDFSCISSTFQKQEIKLFIKHDCFVKNFKLDSHIYHRLIKSMTFLHDKFEVKQSANITSDHILMLFHHLEVENKIRPATLWQYKVFFKKYFNYLISLDYKGKPVVNPILNILLPNFKLHITKTKRIPEDILVFLDNYIHEVKKDEIAIMYHILMETGWRFSDIVSLTENCSEPDETNKEVANIWVSSPKTKNARIKNGLGDTLEDVISIYIHSLISNYVKSTRPLRDVYGITTLFFNLNDGVICKYSPKTFNRAIKNLCKKYDMRSIDENYWNTTSRQTRKTVATSLISSGASLSAVQKKLGHVDSQTTEQFYAEVHNKKISELNTEFYKNKFDMLMDDEKLKRFTEDERRYLYVDFQLGHRDVELGICTKHPSDGRCSLLGYTSCAECPKLCTGNKYLNKWISLAISSKNLILKFEQEYKENNIEIEEYSNYIEYSQEVHLLRHYESVINAIEFGK